MDHSGSGDPDATDWFDPTSREHRELGRGLFDEEMGPGSAMAHLYRGEIHRMRFWRERLDRTTHWSVIVIAAILTWAFSNPSRPHYILLLGTAVLSVFLSIEARRFRAYDIWRRRIRAIQANVFAHALDPSRDPPNPEWRRALSDDYRTPTVDISLEESLAHRLRRVYLPIYGLLGLAWVIRTTGFTDQGWPTSAAVGWLPGAVVIAAAALFYTVLLVVAYRPREWNVEGEIQGSDWSSGIDSR